MRLRPFVIQMLLYHADDNNDDDNDAVDSDNDTCPCVLRNEIGKFLSLIIWQDRADIILVHCARSFHLCEHVSFSFSRWQKNILVITDCSIYVFASHGCCPTLNLVQQQHSRETQTSPMRTSGLTVEDLRDELGQANRALLKAFGF